MRLIDADELIAELRAYKNYPFGLSVDKIPTVKAIPIEWLKRLQERYLEAECYMSVCVVNEIRNLWEKENGISQ